MVTCTSMRRHWSPCATDARGAIVLDVEITGAMFDASPYCPMCLVDAATVLVGQPWYGLAEDSVEAGAIGVPDFVHGSNSTREPGLARRREAMPQRSPDRADPPFPVVTFDPGRAVTPAMS
jgi:hypothetical protein